MSTQYDGLLGYRQSDEKARGSIASFWVESFATR